MVWEGRWEGGSGVGTYVHPWQIHVDVWQNQYSIVKEKKRLHMWLLLLLLVDSTAVENLSEIHKLHLIYIS